MHLADFLETHATEILVDWVRFAETLPSAAGLPVNALRDHAGEMLTAIAHTLRTQRTAAEVRDGAIPDSPELTGPAEAHGSDRATRGFSVTEMTGEFRALRARVVQLWTAEGGARTSADLDDLARFHAAIDQAVGDSVVRYHTGVRDAQELFIAMFGHDLRTPLSTVALVMDHLAVINSADPTQSPLITRAARSAKRMTHMLDDLLDFTRTRAGAGVEVHRRDVDLHRVIEDAVDDARSLSDRHTFVVERSGDLRGAFDAARLGQVLANLLGNAVQHGAVDTPVRVVARGESADTVTIAVCNDGEPIDPSAMPTLFSPYKRLQPGRTTGRDGSHLGLGLYITEQIVGAHGGEITVTSTDTDGTCFTVRLPRSPVASPRSS